MAQKTARAIVSSDSDRICKKKDEPVLNTQDFEDVAVTFF
jgi:hypothetical protein